jgi:hypothetical protein
MTSAVPKPMTAAVPFLVTVISFKNLCNVKIPETIEVVEAVSEYISSYRKSDKLVVTDGCLKAR